MSRHLRALIACGLLLIAATAGAGRSCEEQPIGPRQIYQAGQLALQIRNLLEAAGAELAIVGRVGADLSKYDLKYTHVGIIIRDHPKGRWLFRHLLNTCATAESGLYDEGLINFFTDNPHQLDAVVIVPSSQLQRRLKAAVLGRWAAELHQPKYSAIANPFADRYQNSNQWVLEMIAAAQAGEKIVNNRQTAQAYLANNGFAPDVIPVSGLERVGATLFRANVSFNDHPLPERLKGNYQVVTVRSLIRYLEKTDRILMQQEIRSGQ